MRGTCCILGAGLLWMWPLCSPTAAQTDYFGAAQIDITPTTPIRLSGYVGRDSLPESTGVQEHIMASAAAFGTGSDTSLLITVDSTGVPDNVVDVVSANLSASFGIPRERIVISSTHSHSAPQINGYLPNLFDPAAGRALTPLEQQHINTYTSQITSWLQQVGSNALNNRSPGNQITWGTGSAEFGANRRGFPIAPNDHDLPVMRIVDSQGATRAVIASYATHGTTLDANDNLVSGDWPGYARESIQSMYPGSVGMIMLGAAGDSNPTPAGTVEDAQAHGLTVANEVSRLITTNQMKPVDFKIAAAHDEVNLAFATTRLPGDPASARLAPSPGSIPYGITSWTFGNDVAMVFLEGEPTVDYSLRLKSELNDGRLWINGYSNDVQAYIPSERILYEGGYEADDSSYYYAQPGRFAHGLEDKIVNTVHQQLSAFYAPGLRLRVNLTTGAAEIENPSTSPIAFDAYTIVSASNRLDPSNSRWHSLHDQHIGAWDEADNATTSRLTEFEPHNSSIINSGSSISLGAPSSGIAAPGSLVFGQEVHGDLSFQYNEPGVGLVTGGVDYIGAHNNLVLTIDPSTGAVAIQNESPFFDVSLVGYTFTSASGKLLTGNGSWHSLADQHLSTWDEADNADSSRLTEFNPRGATFLAGGGAVLNLGSPVNVSEGAPTLSDFTFQFSLSTGETLQGFVVLGTLPTNGSIPGDYDGNGIVNAADYSVWRSTFGNSVTPRSGADGNGNGVVDATDYVIWRSQLGSGSGTSISAVPEPHTIALFALVTPLVCGWRLSNDD